MHRLYVNNILLLYILVLCGCLQRNTVTTLPNETLEDKVDREFSKLFKETEGEFLVRPSILKSKKPHEYCKFEKAISIGDLTLSQFSMVQCGGCWDFKIILIHNDKISFALPFWDDYYYWIANGNGDPHDPNELSKLLFKAKLQNFLSEYYQEPDKVRTLNILESIMTMNNFREFRFVDVCGLEQTYRIIKDQYNFTNECKEAFKRNIELIKGLELKGEERNIFLFANFIIIYVIEFDANNGSILKIQQLNHECHNEILL